MMILIGMFDSPFVRRVAVSMNFLGLPFEHRNWSVGKDFDRIREFNPLGRVPTLVLECGEALMESAAILDYLDELAGAGRALLPRSGADRRSAQKILATATGAADKGVLQLYESAFRPREKRHEPWIERCRGQTQSGLDALERHAAAAGTGAWLLGGGPTQADITVVCVYSFLRSVLPAIVEPGRHPALGALAARAESLPEFQAIAMPTHTTPGEHVAVGAGVSRPGNSEGP